MNKNKYSNVLIVIVVIIICGIIFGGYYYHVQNKIASYKAHTEEVRSRNKNRSKHTIMDTHRPKQQSWPRHMKKDLKHYNSTNTNKNHKTKNNTTAKNIINNVNTSASNKQQAMSYFNNLPSSEQKRVLNIVQGGGSAQEKLNELKSYMGQ